MTEATASPVSPERTTVNVARVTDLYVRFSHGDVDVIDELFADEIVAHLLGDTLLAADYAGKPALRDFIVRTIEMNHTEHYILAVDDVLVGGQHIAFTSHVTAVSADSGRKTVIKTHDIMHLDDQAKVDEMWSLTL
jgi:ketosteroid isomerase-like protein